MIDVHINLVAVLLAAIVSLFIGAVWYSPKIFGKHWTRLTGMKMTKSPAGSYLVMFIATLVTCYILAFGIAYAQATTIPQAIVVALLVFVGFILPVTLGPVLWEGKSPRLYLLNNAYQLVSIVVAAIIIAGM